MDDKSGPVRYRLHPIFNSFLLCSVKWYVAVFISKPNFILILKTRLKQIIYEEITLNYFSIPCKADATAVYITVILQVVNIPCSVSKTSNIKTLVLNIWINLVVYKWLFHIPTDNKGGDFQGNYLLHVSYTMKMTFMRKEKPHLPDKYNNKKYCLLSSHIVNCL